MVLWFATCDFSNTCLGDITVCGSITRLTRLQWVAFMIMEIKSYAWHWNCEGNETNARRIFFVGNTAWWCAVLFCCKKAANMYPYFYHCWYWINRWHVGAPFSHLWIRSSIYRVFYFEFTSTLYPMKHRTRYEMWHTLYEVLIHMVAKLIYKHIIFLGRLLFSSRLAAGA